MDAPSAQEQHIYSVAINHIRISAASDELQTGSNQKCWHTLGLDVCPTGGQVFWMPLGGCSLPKGHKGAHRFTAVIEETVEEGGHP